MNEALEIIEYELEGIYSNIELIEKTRSGTKKRRALAYRYWLGQASALERTRKLIQIRQLTKEAE